MSVVNQLKNLFAKAKAKAGESELDSRLSLAMPDVTLDGTDNETLQVSQNAPLQTSMAGLQGGTEDPAAVPTGDLISIPVLGRRTVVEHQRTLFALLGGALVVLAAVICNILRTFTI